MAITKISSKNQVTIPKEVRRFLGVKEGDQLNWVQSSNGEVIIKKADVKTTMLDFFTKMSEEAKKQGLTEEDLLSELDQIREEKRKYGRK
jgi:AbrB family looped-hinge helix DNA binding protein